MIDEYREIDFTGQREIRNATANMESSQKLAGKQEDC